MSRIPHIGAIMYGSRDFEQVRDGRAVRYNTAQRRFESVTSLRDVLQPNTATLTMSGASVTATGLIVLGAILFGVTTLVLDDVVGAPYMVGLVGAPNLWGTNAAPVADSETTSKDFQVIGTAPYAAATDVVLTALNGLFAAGRVEVTAWALTL